MPDEFDQYLEPSSGSDLAAKHAVLYEKGIDPASDPNAKAEMLSLFSSNPKAQEEYINYLNNAQVSGKEEDEFAQYLEKPATKPAVQRPQQPYTQGLGNIPMGGGDIPAGLDVGPYSQALNQLAQPAAIDDAARALTTGITGSALSGMAGLAALSPISLLFGGGLDRATQWQDWVAKNLIHQPTTPGGQQWTQAMGAPFTPFQKAAGAAGGALEEMGAPWPVSATVHSVVEGAPVWMGGPKAIKTGNQIAIDAQLSSAIRSGIEKGVKPSVYGKATFGQSETYLNRAQKAVETIIENKPNLKLTGPEGETVTGLPKNLKQFSQAIEQTKRNVFDQYNAIRQEAGEQGAVIDLNKIAKELETVANNKVVRSERQSVADYAIKKSEAYRNAGSYTLEEAQEAIAILNDSLEGFYKNPSYENATRAYIDSLAANNLRKALDRVINETTGAQYQELKNTYGSLKAIEKDVVHRAIVDARKNTKGLIDFSDVFTGYHALKGLLTLDPATMVSAGGGKTLAWLYRIWNDPNVVVKNMFEKADSLISKRELSKGVMEQVEPPTMNQGWEPNTWDYKLMNSLDNTFRDMHKQGIKPSQLTGQAAKLYKKWELSAMGLRPKMMTPARPTMQGRALPELTPSGAEMAKNFTAQFPQLMLPEKTPLPKSELIFRATEKLKANKPITVEEYMKQLKVRK